MYKYIPKVKRDSEKLRKIMEEHFIKKIQAKTEQSFFIKQ